MQSPRDRVRRSEVGPRPLLFSRPRLFTLFKEWKIQEALPTLRQGARVSLHAEPTSSPLCVTFPPLPEETNSLVLPCTRVTLLVLLLIPPFLAPRGATSFLPCSLFPNSAKSLLHHHLKMVHSPNRGNTLFAFPCAVCKHPSLRNLYVLYLLLERDTQRSNKWRITS